MPRRKRERKSVKPRKEYKVDKPREEVENKPINLGKGLVNIIFTTQARARNSSKEV